MKLILVVDDAADLREEVCMILEFEGYATQNAENGKVALARIQANPPDLIICDVLMPEMTGFELLEILQQNPTYADIPFIFLSAIATLENSKQALDAGANAIIRKPFSVDDVLQTIDSLLK